ncbi:MAG: ArsB/NhaD family transporter [Spirochaetaceae bacterium]|jgi:Na+/H+ antiporter NhaD/arsenite permease-like protein|nr:ArsB/NhaD family transporter [Spirochaetaceae bacterium]
MVTIQWLALGAFLFAYIIISTEKINKTITALLGSAVFIVCGFIEQAKVFQAIDWNVIFLLVSMMVIINITKTTGMFQYVAIKTAKAAKGDPVKILVMLSIITAVFSAFLDNVTTVLILSPVTILIAVELGISPVPFITCLAISSNIGGTATLIGDPPNIMIGSAAGISFISFIINLGPVIIVVLALFALISVMLFRKKLVVSNERKARIMDFDESKSISDKPLLIKCIIVLLLVVLGFLFHSLLKVEASTIAMLGASLLLLLSRKHDIEDFFRDIEWSTIFFFIGLFVLVGGLVEQGWITKCATFIMDVTGGEMKTTTVVLVWVSAFISAIVDNIPYVATMIPMIENISSQVGSVDAQPLWWALSLGACLGGNATLIGASANVVAAGISAKSGYPISFWDFTKYGALITLINMVICTAYVLLRYF